MAATIDKYELRNVVIDPVMVCKGVDAIMVPDAAAIKKLLVKRCRYFITEYYQRVFSRIWLL